MERVDCGQDFTVLVDYAHTPDALHNALSMLRPITRGKVLVVFGCGGNRDRVKRPQMTQVVQSEADEAWATADNPRSETVTSIFEDMKGGVIRPDSIHWVEDRRRAITLLSRGRSPAIPSSSQARGTRPIRIFGHCMRSLLTSRRPGTALAPAGGNDVGKSFAIDMKFSPANRTLESVDGCAACSG
jgi:hypothetical protein